MFKIIFIRISFLEGYAADLLQDSQIMAHCLDAQTFLYHDKLLKFPDELLVELPECQVRDLELRLDEFGKRAVGEEVGRE